MLTKSMQQAGGHDLKVTYVQLSGRASLSNPIAGYSSERTEAESVHSCGDSDNRFSCKQQTSIRLLQALAIVSLMQHEAMKV